MNLKKIPWYIYYTIYQNQLFFCPKTLWERNFLLLHILFLPSSPIVDPERKYRGEADIYY